MPAMEYLSAMSLSEILTQQQHVETLHQVKEAPHRSPQRVGFPGRGTSRIGKSTETGSEGWLPGLKEEGAPKHWGILLLGGRGEVTWF